MASFVGGVHPTYAPAMAQSTEHDQVRDRIKRGQCINCGIQTHKVLGLLSRSLVPITNDHVLSGRCLPCNPLPPDASSASVHPASPDIRDPGWKRHRWVIGGFLLVFVAVLAILGVMLSSRNSSGDDTNDVVVGHPKNPPTPPPTLAIISTPPASPSGVEGEQQSVDALIETDCDDQCSPEVAISGDTAVVTRDFTDVQFFLSTNPTFELVTKIDIDYKPTAAAINENTAVIGSSTENGDVGAVYVYEKDQFGIWYQAMRIVPSNIREGAESGWASITGGTLFGRDVDIYGGVMIVGADDDGAEGQGSVYIFRRSETTWIEEAKLTPPDDSTAEGFGYSVSIKGNTIVVGDLAYGDKQEGAVFVYEFDSLSNSWIRWGSTLMNNGCSWFGSFVTLTHDEELLVSCSESDIVYYYEKQDMGNEYVLHQSIRFDSDVYSIAVDGNVMVVSEHKEGRSAVIHFFERKNHVWEEVDRIDEPTFDESFGYRVALFGNATLVASHRNVYPL